MRTSTTARRVRDAAVMVCLVLVGAGCAPPRSQVGPYVREVHVVDGDLLLRKCWIVLEGTTLEEGPCAEERVAIPPARR